MVKLQSFKIDPFHEIDLRFAENIFFLQLLNKVKDEPVCVQAIF